MSKYRELIADAEKHLCKATGKYDERAKSLRVLQKRLAAQRAGGLVAPEQLAAAEVRAHVGGRLSDACAWAAE